MKTNDTKETVFNKDGYPTDKTKLIDVDADALKFAIRTLTEHKKETAQLVKDNEKAKKEAAQLAKNDEKAIAERAASANGEKYAKSLSKGEFVIYRKSTDKKFGYVGLDIIIFVLMIIIWTMQKHD